MSPSYRTRAVDNGDGDGEATVRPYAVLAASPESSEDRLLRHT